jgi:hypothetical protein
MGAFLAVLAKRELKKKASEKNSDAGFVLDSLKHGGDIQKTGTYELHEGEKVLNKRQAKRYRKGASKR